MIKKKNIYPQYDILKTPLLRLPLEDNEVPQGICQIGEKILISCYTTDATKSRIKIINKEKTPISIILDNKSHVGGISYDNIHNLIFFCDLNGRISAFPYYKFLANNLTHKLTFSVASSEAGGHDLKENKKLCCSYLTCFKNKIYVGSFNKKTRGLVKVFKIVNKKDILLQYETEFRVPRKIQGITFLEDDSTTYLILSKSYGRKYDSELLLYKYNDSSNYTRPLHKLKLPPMLEQITVTNDKKLLLLFESGAKKYENGVKLITDNIISLDIKKIIKDKTKHSNKTTINKMP